MAYDLLETIDHADWGVAPPPHIQQQALYALESGKVIFFPKLSFTMHDHEQMFLSPDVCDANSKNVSYYLHNDELRGTKHQGEHASHLKALLKRYAEHSKQLLHTRIPAL